MKWTDRRVATWCLCATIFLSFGSTLWGQNSIGINFRRDAGQTEMAVDDVAGVIPQAIWNNTDGQPVGNTGNIVSPGPGFLLDGAGALVESTLSWTANTTWNAQNPVNIDTGDERMLDGYIDDTGDAGVTTVTLTNIPYEYYDVYSYIGSDGNDRTGRVRLNQYSTTDRWFRTNTNPFNGYVQATAPTEGDAILSNYVLYQTVTGSDLTLEVIRGSNNVGLHGIQIVQTDGSAPPNWELPPPPPPVAEGPAAVQVGYWTFDGDDASDVSGGGHNGILGGNVSFTDGLYGRAASFDGTGDFIEIQSPGDALKPTDNIAISLFVKNQEPAGSPGEFVSLGDNYGLRMNAGTDMHWFIHNGSAWTGLTTDASDPTETVPADGTWHHVVAQKTPAGLEIWIDGVVADSINGRLLTEDSIGYTLGTSLFFGKHGNNSTAFDFTGMIDEVRIFRGTLSEAQILSLRDTNVVPEPATGLLAAAGLLGLLLAGRRRSGIRG